MYKRQSGGSVLNEQVPMVFESHDITRQIVEKFNLYDLFKISKMKGKFEMINKLLKKYIELESKEKGSMGLELSLIHI